MNKDNKNVNVDNTDKKLHSGTLDVPSSSISDVRSSKLNIHDFMEQLSIDDIRKSIEDNLHYQKTGKRLFDRTIQDEIYEQYFKNLDERKSTMMFESYDIICRELSKRWFFGNVQLNLQTLNNI